jgi:malate permease and related proteins
MSNLLLLLTCLVAGLLLRRFGRAPDHAHTALNAVIVHVSLPAATLHHLHGFSFEARHAPSVLMPWLLFALGAVCFWWLGRALRLPRATVGALTLVGGFGNTSFVGLPMIESLHGRDGLPLGLLIDQLGSYLALSTAGIVVATWYAAEGRPTLRELARKVATFPPFVALWVALSLADVPFAPALQTALARIGDTMVPLALLSVGLQLRFDALREQRRALCAGLAYKLMVCPALVVALLWGLGIEADMVARVSVIEAAMPPMIGAGIVAAQAKLDTRLVSALIGIGIPLGVSTAVMWFWLFGAIGAVSA